MRLHAVLLATSLATACARPPPDSGDAAIPRDAGTHDANTLDAGRDASTSDAGPTPCPAPEIDPATFGALGDGVADDAPALRAALTLAAASGGAVVLDGAATYRLATATDTPWGRSTLPISGHQVALRGNGATLSLADGVHSESVIVIAGTPDAPATAILIEDLTVHANYDLNRGGTNTHSIEVHDAHGVIFRNLTVTDSRTAISVSDRAEYVLFRDSTVVRYEHDGFEVSGTNASAEDDPHHVVFTGCRAMEPGLDNDWEIEDGAHDVWLFDSFAERRLFIRNHAYPDRITSDIVFVRTEADYYQIFGYEAATDGTPLPVNWVERVSFFDAVGLVVDQIRTRDVRVETPATVQTGRAQILAGQSTVTIDAPAVSPTSLELPFVTSLCTNGAAVSVVERMEGVGFVAATAVAVDRDTEIEWWVVDAAPAP